MSAGGIGYETQGFKKELIECSHMLFNSIEFGFFLVLSFFLYWFVFNQNIKSRNFFLLIISYIFYGWWDWRFLALLIVSSMVDYIVANKMYEAPSATIRKRYLVVSLVTNLGLLGVFKYFNFFSIFYLRK